MRLSGEPAETSLDGVDEPRGEVDASLVELVVDGALDVVRGGGSQLDRLGH